MLRKSLSPQVEFLESLTLLSGVNPSLTPLWVAVLPGEIASARHLGASTPQGARMSVHGTSANKTTDTREKPLSQAHVALVEEASRSALRRHFTGMGRGFIGGAAGARAYRR